jgi:hypothetical protein
MMQNDEAVPNPKKLLYLATLGLLLANLNEMPPGSTSVHSEVCYCFTNWGS